MPPSPGKAKSGLLNFFGDNGDPAKDAAKGLKQAAK
ncbi:unnamed protein product [Phaeothamnion confervicola]